MTEPIIQGSGIGIAFGATQHDLLAMILADGLGCGLFGIYFGLAGSFAATRLLSSPLYGAKTTPFRAGAESPNMPLRRTHRSRRPVSWLCFADFFTRYSGSGAACRPNAVGALDEKLFPTEP